MPVHFVYLTAFATATGLAQFRPDIYGRDSSFGDPDDQQDAVVAQQAAPSRPNPTFARTLRRLAAKPTELRTRHRGARQAAPCMHKKGE